jgi:hypothetical protein
MRKAKDKATPLAFGPFIQIFKRNLVHHLIDAFYPLSQISVDYIFITLRPLLGITFLNTKGMECGLLFV